MKPTDRVKNICIRVKLAHLTYDANAERRLRRPCQCNADLNVSESQTICAVMEAKSVRNSSPTFHLPRGMSMMAIRCCSDSTVLMQQHLAQRHHMYVNERADVHAVRSRIDEIEQLAITNVPVRDTSWSRGPCT
jgi:hypothetical protein